MKNLSALPVRSTHPLTADEMEGALRVLMEKGAISEPETAWDSSAANYLYAIVDLERAGAREEPYLHIGTRRAPAGLSGLSDDYFGSSSPMLDERRRAGAKLVLFVLSAWRDHPSGAPERADALKAG